MRINFFSAQDFLNQTREDPLELSQMISFGNFVFGSSSQEIFDELKKHQIIMDFVKPKVFSIEVDLCYLLKKLVVGNEDWVVDDKKCRVYYDRYHYALVGDFLPIVEENYFLFEDKGKFYVQNEYFTSYSVEFPQKFERHLRSLKFKFFKNKLYAIEYQGQFKDYELSTIKKNYDHRYGFTLNKPFNEFQYGNNQFFIWQDIMKKEMRFIIRHHSFDDEIDQELNHNIEVILKALEKINQETLLSKQFILSFKKEKLKEFMERSRQYNGDINIF